MRDKSNRDKSNRVRDKSNRHVNYKLMNLNCFYHHLYVFGFIKRVDKGRITTVKDLESGVDVSSVSPLSDRITKGERSIRQLTKSFKVIIRPVYQLA